VCVAIHHTGERGNVIHLTLVFLVLQNK
jgi:hypothetical protein